MNINHLLIWFVGTCCVFSLIRLARLPLSDNPGWMIVTVFILVVMIVMLYLAPAVAGLISGSLLGILVLLPIMVIRKVNQLIYQERYGQASRMAARLRWLHPADGWLQAPELLRGLEIGQRGEMAEAIAIFNRYQTTTTSIGRIATIYMYRMESRWEELLLWIRDNIPEKVWFRDPALIGYYLRTLGETGDLNGLLHELQRFEGSLEKQNQVMTLNLVRMFALAFCGQTEQVQRLFASSLAVYSQNIRQFWLATAEMASGNEAVAREQLLALRDSSNITFDKAIAWRLSHSCVAADRVLSDSSKQILSRLKTELKQEERYGKAFSFIGSKAYATYGVICLNLLVFAIEIGTGGSENFVTLYRLGALFPTVVWYGEWWRLLSATFLHFGFLHLAMNMLGLYFIGVFVESYLGIWRYLISYFFSGVGSMLVITVLAVALSSPVKIVVGASGAIMGLIGVTLSILLWGWLQEKSRIANKRLRTVLFIIGLQVFFDLTTPQVSFLGHISGLILGFLIGSLLMHNWRFRN